MRKWLIGICALLLLAGFAGFVWARVQLKPMLRERVIVDIKEQYKSEVEIKDLKISMFPRFSAVGENLILHQKNGPGLPPLITIKRLTVNATLSGMLSEPIRVERVILKN